MKTKLWYVVAIGPVVKANSFGGVYNHGEVIFTFDAEDVPKYLIEGLGLANIDVVDEETYEKEYK